MPTYASSPRINRLMHTLHYLTLVTFRYNLYDWFIGVISNSETLKSTSRHFSFCSELVMFWCLSHFQSPIPLILDLSDSTQYGYLTLSSLQRLLGKATKTRDFCPRRSVTLSWKDP